MTNENEKLKKLEEFTIAFWECLKLGENAETKFASKAVEIIIEQIKRLQEVEK
jgi:hypothetical protein